MNILKSRKLIPQCMNKNCFVLGMILLVNLSAGKCSVSFCASVSGCNDSNDYDAILPYLHYFLSLLAISVSDF